MKNNKQKTFSTLNILWRGLAAAFSLFAIVAVSGCGEDLDPYVNIVKNSTLENLDKTRTLGQAFEDNPEIDLVGWKSVELRNGRIAVEVTYTPKKRYDKIDWNRCKDKVILAHEIEALCVEVTFVFLLSADLDSFSLEWIEEKITKENIETVIRGLNEYKEQDPFKKNMILDIIDIKPITFKKFDEDSLKAHAIRRIYEGRLYSFSNLF